MKIAAVSGSLRAGSSNTAVLRAAARVAPADVEIVLFRGIEELPFFNPDLDGDDVPAPVGALRGLVGSVDGILISSPEYARGVAGVLKNALDWLVGSHEFPDKPVALINTSPRATHALAALTLTLETMSARIARNACVTLPLLGRPWDENGIVADPALAEPLRAAMEDFAAFIRAAQAEAS
ncbi:NADPH-dependent FMN reductase [Bradyrhizobium betae]|uniref:NAD(P)H-dependent oxidoreductase n=1 Tax=Bradyrhizobium betae TaxID=244734 RepID=A0A5P6P4P7_9BRAD|nr:NADPH-dependent FMN reductase [Bradyrhizobium betae]MCS3731205.1 NAD(P)H-dependent FMN reductase [Bradyrhizobium betae]QFI73166.1 NAD(P)H-dependent oxidoreductase [Bradyrhizobium betae]